jgi:hypothetical protein
MRSNSNEFIKPALGYVNILIEDSDNKKNLCQYNTILKGGKNAMADSLSGEIGPIFQAYGQRMLFGNNGTVAGVSRYVDEGRTSLFGPTVVSKSVNTVRDNTDPKVSFVSVLTKDDAVGIAIDEMALELASGTLYSMLTMGQINKTSTMQITFTWTFIFG